jgi:DNA invertase Pin-like site-specific DNA recombinase
MTLSTVPVPTSVPAPGTVPAAPVTGTGSSPVPVAFLGRTSTLVLQDPAASLGRQLRKVQERLPDGWFIAAHFWDVESGGLDLEQRGHGTGYDKLNVNIPRDGGLAALLAEAKSPSPRFAVVMCEDIARSGRDTYNALRLEKELSGAGIVLLAADEPIDIAGTSATTLLVRRMKQSVAEWYRYELKEKAAAGFVQHSLAGYNNGRAPYGYLADRSPHPVPSKAAQGCTKTRLILDPVTAPVVEQIFSWRVSGRVGMDTIANRLNTDPVLYPPPGKSGCWQAPTIAGILANPKYTGHMVYGRTRTKNGQRGRDVPKDQWLWTPEPAHPAIIDRPTWDAAQGEGQAHSTSTDTPGLSNHPAAKTVYPLRGIIRCHHCGRRLTGRRVTGRRGQITLYYDCPHNPSNPRHAANFPDHPKCIKIRQDLLAARLAEFFDTRIFGPDRAALLAATLPGAPAAAGRKREQDTAKLSKRLRDIDAAEDAYTREIEQFAALGADNPAVTALRSRILTRFGELETERAQINTKLTALATATPATPDPALLDQLPRLAGLLNTAPAVLQQELYRLFHIQITYHHQENKITCHATITHHTTRQLTALTSHQPAGHTTSGHPETLALLPNAARATSGRQRCSGFPGPNYTREALVHLMIGPGKRSFNLSSAAARPRVRPVCS